MHDRHTFLRAEQEKKERASLQKKNETKRAKASATRKVCLDWLTESDCECLLDSFSFFIVADWQANDVEVKAQWQESIGAEGRAVWSCPRADCASSVFLETMICARVCLFSFQFVDNVNVLACSEHEWLNGIDTKVQTRFRTEFSQIVARWSKCRPWNETGGQKISK